MPSLFLEFGVREGNWSQEPSFHQWVSCRAGFDPGDPPRHLSKPRLECSRWPITSVSLLRPHCKQAALPPAGWKGPAKASTTWVPAPAPALQCLDLLHLHLVASSYLCGTFPSQGVLFSLSFELSLTHWCIIHAYIFVFKLSGWFRTTVFHLGELNPFMVFWQSDLWPILVNKKSVQ